MVPDKLYYLFLMNPFKFLDFFLQAILGVINPLSPTLRYGRQRTAGKEVVQFIWDHTSLVALTVKNLPAMQETWVLSLGWEDPLQKGMATHSSILAWRIP